MMLLQAINFPLPRWMLLRLKFPGILDCFKVACYFGILLLFHCLFWVALSRISVQIFKDNVDRGFFCGYSFWAVGTCDAPEVGQAYLLELQNVTNQIETEIWLFMRNEMVQTGVSVREDFCNTIMDLARRQPRLLFFSGKKVFILFCSMVCTHEIFGPILQRVLRPFLGRLNWNGFRRLPGIRKRIFLLSRMG